MTQRDFEARWVTPEGIPGVFDLATLFAFVWEKKLDKLEEW